MSPRIRSPSPTFAFPGSPTPNLMSPASDSSGFSSKKSSNDNFNLEGMYIYIYIYIADVSGHDIAEILLKLVLNTNQSINHMCQSGLGYWI